MPLGQARMEMVGESPYAHEQEAIRFVQEQLPNVDPYHAWALFDLADPSTGRLHEIDLLVIGYGAIYLVEVKSHPGRITGDATDWYWFPPDGGRKWIEPPFRLANHKAKVLKSRLRARFKNERELPFIQALVFLSAENLSLDLRPEGRIGVVTRGEVRDALTHHQFVGASASHVRRIDRPQVQALARALEKLGVRPRKGKVFAGSYELGSLLHEGPAYQDREATHRDKKRVHARARTYLVPQQTTVERKQQLRRAADREFELLYDVREHPGVLHVVDYVAEAPLGPTVLFEDFEGGAPLPAFLRNEPSASFDDRLEILEKVARALAHCHRRSVFHGGLCPEAVLVRRKAEPGSPDKTVLEVRLHDFLLGQSQEVEGTSHWSALAPEASTLYMAPELLEGHPRDALTDVFSLGALAYYLFTGQAPAESLPALYAKLARDQQLDVRIVGAAANGERGDLPSALADAIDIATAVSRLHRYDDAEEWIEAVLEDLTSSEASAPAEEPNPLEARAGDVLGDLEVQGPLGQGATSRVLLVRRASDGRELALKVSLSIEHDERLAVEAEVLRRLQHPRIVSFVDERTIAGRRCLLLGLAGRTTLRRKLDRDGTVSLDFAGRYGDDLLSALEHLEDEDVQLLHRDIKPANLGVGAPGKGAHHLALFDFSLAAAPLGELGIGTSAYRDPFLPARGAWDAAADRWSAAITLHEMLTGVRPSYGGSALDSGASLVLAAERFDPSAREGLTAFFERALHRDVERRFASAKEMRHAWFRAFEAPSVHPPARAPSAAPSDADAERQAPPELGDEALRALSLETPVEALPLSARAKNALDRAGLTRAGELLALPENRLSAVRGVGTKVADEILSFRDRWAKLRPAAPESAAAFFAGYDGGDLSVRSVGLAEALGLALIDGGLPTLRAVARAPKAQVEALVGRAGESPEALRRLLRDRRSARTSGDAPLSIEALLAAFLPAKKKGSVYARGLFGLDPPFEGRLDVTAKEVAAHYAKTTANIYLTLGRLRDDWATHAELDPLRDRAERLLERAQGAEPLGKAAETLLGLLPHDESTSEPLRVARAAALLRIVAEVEKEELDGLRIARLGRGELWLMASQSFGEALRRLGRAADALAERDVLVSAGEAQRHFEEVARGTPLDGIGDARLAEWAAASSDRAARSARLEIYPRGLSPERAIAHSAGLLVGELTPEQVVAKVLARYPEAAPVPPRPELDSLLERLELTWNEAERVYRRKGQGHETRLETSLLSRTTTASHSAHTIRDEGALEASEFEKRLQIALEKSLFRVLTVSATHAPEATTALEAKLRTKALPLDRALLRAMNAIMLERGVDRALVHAADREGKDGEDWEELLVLAREAEARVVGELRARTEPLLLTQPGLLARYRLVDLLKALVARCDEDDAPAIFLVVPGPDRGGVPLINGVLPVPGVRPNLHLRVPRAFYLEAERVA